MNRATVILIAIAGLAAGAALGRPVDEARAAAQRGEAAYAAGKYDEALAEFERAAAALPDPPPELLHNQAAALFKLGRLSEARALWEQIRTRKDAAFEARTTYNLGNVDYAEALASAQPPGGTAPDPEAAQRCLAAAADRYRAALRLDPTLTDARANLELAELLRRQLAQLPPQTKPGQSSRRSDPQPDSRPATQPERPQGSPQPPDSPESSGPQESEPSQGATSPEDSTSSQDAAAAHRDSQPADADRRQNPSASQFEQPSPPESADPQDRPTDEAQRDAADAPPVETQPAEPSAAEPTTRPAGVKLTREQAERLLQRIREAEKARREALARQRDARRPPVDRDW